MRVALIRGSLLRAWELPNYMIDGVEVEVLASTGVAARLGATVPPVRGLPGFGDMVARGGPRAAAVADLLLGPVEYVHGLEDALRGFDVAHALELANPFTVQALAARDAGACRAVVATVMENMPYRPAPNRVVERRVRRAAAGVDMFLAITEHARLHLNTAGVEDDRIRVIPLGIDMTRFAPAPGPRREGPLRVLSVARLETAKGVEDLVVAAGLLARRGVDLELTLAGAGPLHGRLERIAADLGIAGRVTLGGTTPWEQLERVYQAHDVFVLASAPTRNWREQFGFAIVEAMACGLPVLAGGSGSLPEVVPGEDSLVRPHDPLDLADALERVAADPELRRRQGERNRAWALERYDQRKVREWLRDVYERVARTP